MPMVNFYYHFQKRRCSMHSWFLSGDALISSINKLSLPDNCCALWPIGQVGFFLKYQNTTILIDPVLTPITDSAGKSQLYFEAPFSPEAPFSVDAVFCTHDHLDHLNPDTIARIAASHPETRFYVPAPALQSQHALFEPFIQRVTGIRQGETLNFGNNCNVTGIEAAHNLVLPASKDADKPATTYYYYDSDNNGNAKALGYFFRFGDLTLFHAGDTVATDRLVQAVRKCGPVTLSLLPINGRDWLRENTLIGNMTPLEAVLFADQIDTEAVIPTHYDMFIGNEEDPMIFEHYMNLKCPGRACHRPHLGEPFILYR